MRDESNTPTTSTPIYPIDTPLNTNIGQSNHLENDNSNNNNFNDNNINVDSPFNNSTHSTQPRSQNLVENVQTIVYIHSSTNDMDTTTSTNVNFSNGVSLDRSIHSLEPSHSQSDPPCHILTSTLKILDGLKFPSTLLKDYE